jgi:GNAT superfamily N-acetyltransferase
VTGPTEAGRACEVIIRVVPLDHPQARQLERRHIADMQDRYGGRGPGPVERGAFEPPDGCFIVAVIDDEPVGCGGFRPLRPQVAEIKRMFVDAGARRRGVGRLILTYLEDQARTAGHNEVWLETGSEQPEAIALYVSAGYRPMDAYGEFKHDGRSRCFYRTLGI